MIDFGEPRPTKLLRARLLVTYIAIRYSLVSVCLSPTLDFQKKGGIGCQLFPDRSNSTQVRPDVRLSTAHANPRLFILKDFQKQPDNFRPLRSTASPAKIAGLQTAKSVSGLIAYKDTPFFGFANFLTVARRQSSLTVGLRRAWGYAETLSLSAINIHTMAIGVASIGCGAVLKKYQAPTDPTKNAANIL